jgi:serine protease Do
MYDRIVEFDGTEVSSYAEINRLILQYSVGDKVTVKVERDNREIPVTMTLQEATQN